MLLLHGPMMCTAPSRDVFRALGACVLLATTTLVGCGGDGTSDPTGSGTWPVVDLVDVTTAPSALRTAFAIAGPNGAVVDGAEVRLSLPRTGVEVRAGATDAGAFVGRVTDAQPGDTLEVRLAYDGKVSVPAQIELPPPTDTITMANVTARKNLDGNQVGVGGTFTTTLGQRPRFRAFTAAGTARVSDSPLDGNPNIFLIRLDAELGETIVVHGFDRDDPSITTQFIEVVVTP